MAFFWPRLFSEENELREGIIEEEEEEDGFKEIHARIPRISLAIEN